MVITVYRAELVEHGACGTALHLFDDMTGGAASITVDASPLHLLWLAVAYPDECAWLYDRLKLPLRVDACRADLRGVDMRDAYLPDADFSYCDLEGADLRAAYLVDATFVGANLRGVDFRGSFLDGADLGIADYAGADFTRAWCDRTPPGWVRFQARLHRPADMVML